MKGRRTTLPDDMRPGPNHALGTPYGMACSNCEGILAKIEPWRANRKSLSGKCGRRPALCQGVRNSSIGSSESTKQMINVWGSDMFGWKPKLL